MDRKAKEATHEIVTDSGVHVVAFSSVAMAKAMANIKNGEAEAMGIKARYLAQPIEDKD